MTSHDVPSLDDIDTYLAEHERKSLLRFITCGSVDDGKSTLLGRLLYESQSILDDQMATLAADSRRVGTQGDEIDFALLVDGLEAEREQGITIDVAYRFLTTSRCKFIVADTPGHVQYTRNMVTGASTADLAVLLVDARKGVLPQTRRHTYVVSLMGIRQVVVAVNKLDLVEYDREVFDAIEQDYRTFVGELGITDVQCIPVSALRGDNLVAPSPRTPWYAGPTLMACLEAAQGDDVSAGPFRFLVQWVNRPGPDFRGYSGIVVGGALQRGDRVVVLPRGIETSVDRIVTADGDLDRADADQSVTITLADDIDVARGDVIAALDGPPTVSDQVEAHLVWMDEHEMLPGRRYLMKLGSQVVNATPARPKYAVNIDTLEHVSATTLALNEIGVCNLSLDRQIVFDPYSSGRDLGGFILIDRISNATVGAGMVHFGLRRADNLHWQHVEVDHAAHAALKGHKPAVVWLTGLSGAGKSTIANVLEKKLHAHGAHTFLLDGDNVRHGLCRDLGFTDADRVENIRRVGEVCKLMTQAGLVVVAAFISPFAAERRMVRELVGPGRFCEVFVDAPIEVVTQRDPKGLYGKALRGQLKNFTGVDSPYEPPANPEIVIDSTSTPPAAAADEIIDHLRRGGVLPSWRA